MTSSWFCYLQRIYIYAEDGILKEKPGALVPEDSAAWFRAGGGGGANLTEICTQSKTILQGSGDGVKCLNLSILCTSPPYLLKFNNYVSGTWGCAKL